MDKTAKNTQKFYDDMYLKEVENDDIISIFNLREYFTNKNVHILMVCTVAFQY